MRGSRCALALLPCLAFAPARAQPRGAETLTCTNPASGASWPVQLDLAAGTVDANPATVDAGSIDWRDRDGRTYTLDRRSGALTVIVPSSTGGYFIHDRCQVPH